MKSSTATSVQSPMEMGGTELTSWARMFVFLMLIIRSNSVQAWAKQLMSSWRAASVCAVRAASSANSNSHMRTFRTLVFAWRRARLNRLPSLLVWRYTPSSDWQQGEQVAEKCWDEDTALFNTALDRKGVRGRAIVLDSAVHILMEGRDHRQELGGTSDSLQECKQPCPAD